MRIARRNDRAASQAGRTCGAERMAERGPVFTRVRSRQLIQVEVHANA